MIATLRRLLLVAAGAVALSASALAQNLEVPKDFLAAAHAAYQRGDYAEAAPLYVFAAARGHAAAEYQLGVMYFKGQGVPQSTAEALEWYRLAANHGNANAQYNLGVMYDDGEGVAQDSVEAARWYRLAADQGKVDAQVNLGVMYDDGQGVPQNYVEAYKWFDLAAAQGDSEAASYRNAVRNKMTPAQIAEARKLSAALKPK